MKKIFSIIIISAVVSFLGRSVELTVIDTAAENQECGGEVVLTSSSHDHTITILAEDLRKKPRKRVKIKQTIDGRLLNFEYISMTGNCRWFIWNKYRSGESVPVERVQTYEPGWFIKAVKLL